MWGNKDSTEYNKGMQGKQRSNFIGTMTVPALEYRSETWTKK
jgi:hypothetical protein